jgi:hypothetical protein
MIAEAKSGEEEQGKEGAGELLREVASNVGHQQGVGIKEVTRGAENGGAPAGHPPQKNVSRKTGKGLEQDNEGNGDGDIWNEKGKRCTEHPGEWRIKDEAWLAEAVVGPGSPAWIENALLPLRSSVEPGSRVKLKIVAGSGAVPEKRQDDE